MHFQHISQVCFRTLAENGEENQARSRQSRELACKAPWKSKSLIPWPEISSHLCFKSQCPSSFLGTKTEKHYGHIPEFELANQGMLLLTLKF